jgi:hypothetical protein
MRIDGVVATELFLGVDTLHRQKGTWESQPFLNTGTQKGLIVPKGFTDVPNGFHRQRAKRARTCKM